MIYPIILAAIGRLKRLKAAYDAHAAATGTSVHGLGTMSTQNKGAVDIEGGTIDNTPVGATTMETVDAKRVREAAVDMGSATSFALDWAAYGLFKISPSGAFSVTHTNKPGSGRAQVVWVDVYFAGAPTTPTWTGVTWLTAAPTLASGHNWVYFFCPDGSTVYGGTLA